MFGIQKAFGGYKLPPPQPQPQRDSDDSDVEDALMSAAPSFVASNQMAGTAVPMAPPPAFAQTQRGVVCAPSSPATTTTTMMGFPRTADSSERSSASYQMVAVDTSRRQLVSFGAATRRPAALPARPPQRTMLVVGPTEVGKSTFVNRFRDAVAPGCDWQRAQSGRSGRHGTIYVRAYYSAASQDDAVWRLVDVPGWVSKPDVDVLQRLAQGVAPGQALGGTAPVAAPDLAASVAHRPHCAVIVVDARQLALERPPLIHMSFFAHVEPAPSLEATVECVADAMDALRPGLRDRSPRIVVTHVDQFLRPQDAAALCVRSLSRYAPPECIYPMGLPDADAVGQLLRLHNDLFRETKDVLERDEA